MKTELFPLEEFMKAFTDPSLNIELSECQQEVFFACLSVGVMVSQGI